MQVRGVDFVGVAVSCTAAAREFYGDILGLRPVGEFAKSWAERDAGDVTPSLIEADAGAMPRRLEAGPEAAIGLAAAVPDVAAAGWRNWAGRTSRS